MSTLVRNSPSLLEGWINRLYRPPSSHLLTWCHGDLTGQPRQVLGHAASDPSPPSLMDAANPSCVAEYLEHMSGPSSHLYQPSPHLDAAPASSIGEWSACVAHCSVRVHHQCPTSALFQTCHKSCPVTAPSVPLVVKNTSRVTKVSRSQAGSYPPSGLHKASPQGIRVHYC